MLVLSFSASTFLSCASCFDDASIFLSTCATSFRWCRLKNCLSYSGKYSGTRYESDSNCREPFSDTLLSVMMISFVFDFFFGVPSRSFHFRFISLFCFVLSFPLIISPRSTNMMTSIVPGFDHRLSLRLVPHENASSLSSSTKPAFPCPCCFRSLGQMIFCFW